MGLRHCRIRVNHRRKLIEYFVMEVTARLAADVIGVHPNTAALFYHKLREIIAKKIADDVPFDGKIEVDESYFGGVRKGKRGRGAAGKVPVFGLLKRGGKVYAVPVPDTSSKTLKAIMVNKIRPDSVVYTDGYRSYNVLDVSGFRHFRINHSLDFVDGHNHINGIENFWNQAKRILRKYNAIPRKNFPLFLKECEFRFNYGSPRQQIRLLLNWIKS